MLGLGPELLGRAPHVVPRNRQPVELLARADAQLQQRRDVVDVAMVTARR